MVNGNTFYISQVTAEFLMDVLDLEEAPKYLKSESTGLIVKIDPSFLKPNEFYVVKGPGQETISRTRKLRNRGKHHISIYTIFFFICDRKNKKAA